MEKQAEELGIDKAKALNAYRNYWVFIKDIIEGMELDDITEEEFDKLRPSINLPNLGKFYTTYKDIQLTNKRIQITNERIKNKKSNSDV